MATRSVNRISSKWIVAAAAVACLVLVSLFMIFFVAPTEATMGDVQRIIYLHVSVAWCGLASMLVTACCGAMYLARRRLEWDSWSQAAAEVGCLCATLTLMTGSAWAHEAWGTWWTWEPRLTSSFVLWIMYAGLLLIRSSIEDPRRRADQRGIGVGQCRRCAARADGYPVVSRRPSDRTRDGSSDAICAANFRRQLHSTIRVFDLAASSTVRTGRANS